jgi:adenylate cyclase
MCRALEDFNRLRTEQSLEPIKIGIGVNTGGVIAGAIGSSRTLQYTVIGDAVNVASRLCSVAKADEIIISESTYASCKEQIIVERHEPVKVKGKSGPLPIYRAMGLRDLTGTQPPSTQVLPHP